MRKIVAVFGAFFLTVGIGLILIAPVEAANGIKECRFVINNTGSSIVITDNGGYIYTTLYPAGFEGLTKAAEAAYHLKMAEICKFVEQ